MKVMATPSLDKELYKYWSMLTPYQKESLLNIIKSFVNPNEVIERISIEQYNQELEIAEKEIENEDYLSHEDALKEIQKW